MQKILFFFALFFMALTGIFSQSANEKIIFPTAPNMEASNGQFLIPTADGGFLLTGTSRNNSTGNYGVPRLIKLDAALQVSWDKSYLERLPPNGLTTTLQSPALQTADGGYAMAFNNDSTATDFLRLDANGDILWEKDLTPYSFHLQLLGILPDGSFVLTIKTTPYFLVHLDVDGNVITQTSLVSNASNGSVFSILLSNNDVLTTYRTPNNKTVFLRTDVAGGLIWQSPELPAITWSFNLGGPKMAAMSDGGFVITSYDASINNNRLIRFDALGNLTWTSDDNAIPSSLSPNNIAVTANDQFLLSGFTNTNRAFVAQMTPIGDGIEWIVESPEDGQEHLTNLNAIPTDDGWAAGVGRTVEDNFCFLKVGANTGLVVNTLSGRVAKDDNDNCMVDLSESGLYHARVNASNGLETFGAFTTVDGAYSIDLPSGDFTLSVLPNELFYSLCPGANNIVSFPAGVNGAETRDLPMASAERIHEISGNFYLDQDANCSVDLGEPALANWKLKVHTSGGTLNLTTNSNGFYKTFVPDGTYTIEARPWNNNFSICSPNEQTVSLAGPDPQTITTDFSAQAAFSCARMRADLSTTIRPCTTQIVQAFYRNDGTVTATDATLKVTLDPLLTYTSASQTPVLVDGQSITFNLGDVPAFPAGHWVRIDIVVETDCSLQIGDQVCLSAQVTPDEDCTQNLNWNGAIVAVNGNCENGEAIFSIKNVGTAPNAQVLQYIITEDQIVLRQSSFQLNPGEELFDTVPGNGLPLTIEAQQEPGYPGDTSVVWNIVNCGGSGNGMWSGFGGPAGPFTHQECFTISNSFDPNDKNAIPEGHGPEHFVHPGTPLEYHIRFQNTGNDTAYLVVIRDTLSPHFNAGKIEARGSSHPYEFAQINDNILQFTFNNILLPDSSSNQAGSQGFVDFTVYPKDDLPDGTEVLNSAAIYFDFNEPVITNTVKRVYGKYVFLETETLPGRPALAVKHYPNPFSTETTFEISEQAPAEKYQLNLLDAHGRALKTLDFDGNKCLLRREQLPAGVLAWSIHAAGRILASGTVIAQ